MKNFKILKLLAPLLLVGVIVFVSLWNHVSIGGSGGLLSISVAKAGDTPVVEPRAIDNGDGTYTYKNKWLRSYETIYFSTPDEVNKCGNELYY
jgi:hypothetical protein